MGNSLIGGADGLSVEGRAEWSVERKAVADGKWLKDRERIVPQVGSPLSRLGGIHVND